MAYCTFTGTNDADQIHFVLDRGDHCRGLPGEAGAQTPQVDRPALSLDRESVALSDTQAVCEVVCGLLMNSSKSALMISL